MVGETHAGEASMVRCFARVLVCAGNHASLRRCSGKWSQVMEVTQRLLLRDALRPDGDRRRVLEHVVNGAHDALLIAHPLLRVAQRRGDMIDSL